MPLGKLEAEAAPAAAGTRRDPAKVSMFSPYNIGDVVTINGQDWTVKQDTPGWYITDNGDWRGMHPTIREIRAMSDLIREIEQAATATPTAADPEEEPTFTEAQARNQFEWRDLGQTKGNKTHMLFFFTKPEDKGTGRAMGYGTVELFQGASGWKIRPARGLKRLSERSLLRLPLGLR